MINDLINNNSKSNLKLFNIRQIYIIKNELKPTSLDNSRPISIASFWYKVIEKAISLDILRRIKDLKLNKQ